MVGTFGLAPRGTMRVRALPLARALAARGHQVLVVMPPWHTPEEGGMTWDQDGVYLEYVRVASRGSVPGHVRTLYRLVRRVLSWRPDVVHCFKPKAYAGLTAWVLWHLRPFVEARFRLIVDEDDWEGKGGWYDMPSHGRLTREFFAWQERWGLTHCDAVTVASRTLESLVWSLGTSPVRVHHVPNGSGMSPSAANGSDLRDALGIGSSPVILLYTRFFEYDVARVVAAYARIAAQIPEARLLVVGKGLYPRDEERFDALIASEGLSASVIKVGWVPPESLQGYLALCDAALFPFDDNLVNRAKCSVKLADLLAMGCPVVAEAVGENAQYIEAGRSGFLVESGDVEAMAETCVRVLRDPELGKTVGRAAVARMQTDYAWSSLAERVLLAYRGGKA